MIVQNMDYSLEQFMQLTKEYKRFADYFVELRKRIIDTSEDDEYISVYTRLMLLRKYGLKNDLKFRSIFNKAQKRYPKFKDQFDMLKEQYNSIYKKLEYILPNGTSMAIGDAVEDTIYGLYLHADCNRLQNVNIADENLRYSVIKDYVNSLEKIILKTYELLLSCKDNWNIPKEKYDKAHIVYLGNSTSSDHDIKGSPYWSNAYGRDANVEDLLQMYSENTNEDKHILMFCEAFVHKLYKDDYSASELKWYIYPPTRKDWGDFSLAHNMITEYQNVGFGSKVRYNERHDMAYVRILRDIEEPFIIDQQHLANGIFTITLVKENERYGWRIFSIGNPIDNYKETLSLGESIQKLITHANKRMKKQIIKSLM